MVLNTLFRMTFRCFQLLHVYICLQNYFLTEIQVRLVIICLQNLFLNLSSIQMSAEHWTDPWATSVAQCTLEALGECLQSRDVVFLFVLKIRCLPKIIM